MTIDLKCKPWDKLYFVSKNFSGSIIPVTCREIVIVNTQPQDIFYYFQEVTLSFTEQDFNNCLFIDYNVAQDALQEYRAHLGDKNE